MTAILTFLLATPVLISFYYSNEKDFLWLFLSLFALIIVIYMTVSVVKKIANNIVRKIIGTFVIFLLAIFELSRLVSFYFQGESFNERFFFHFNFNSIAEAGSAYLPSIIVTVAFLSVITCLCWVLFGQKSQQKGYLGSIQLLLIVLAVFILEPDVSKLSTKQMQTLVKTEENLAVDTIAWEALGLNREALLATINDVIPGKNLVFIYLESLEEIYTDENLFPGLTPNLNKLRQSGLTFSRMLQTEGTSWTVGGMVASQCGTPLLYGFGPGDNDILQSGFLNQAICFGDVLEQAGYYQVFLGGASAEFAGKGSFLASHGYDEVNGKIALSEYLEDGSYLSGWGLYDDSLFAIAEERFKQLAQGYQPFNLTLLTLDTHHPGGDASRSCPDYEARDNSMLDAVHCSDFLVNQFVEAISKHPAWEDTLVVLFSDHLAMRNVAQQYYPVGYDRRLLLTILNADTKGEVDKTGSHMDIAPTLLHLMGVQHERHFLAGENLMNTSQQSPDIDLFSSQRLDALKYINNNYLTRSDYNICDNNQLVDVYNGHLKIGENEIVMSVSGQPIAFESLGVSHGVLTTLDDEGKVKLTITVNLENLPHVLYQFSGDQFLLIAKVDRLSGFIKTEEKQIGEISVFMGNLQGKIDYLGGSSDPVNLRIKNLDCTKRLERIVGSIEEKQPKKLLEICLANDFGENFLDPITGNIHLAKVAYENEWYEVVLSNSAIDQYRVKDLLPLGSINFNPAPNYCHAYFGNSELIIPDLVVESQKQAIRMQLIPGADWLFKVMEKANRSSV
jgi:Sulfatase